MNNTVQNDLTLVDLLSALKRHKRIVALTPIVFLVLSIAYLHIAQQKYSVVLKVAPIDSSNVSVPGGLGNLASFAGLSIPSAQESNSFELYLEGIKSRQAATAIAANQVLMQKLFVEEWDNTEPAWREPSGILRTLQSLAKAMFGFYDAPWQPPNGTRVAEYLENELRVLRDTSSPIVTISIDHRDPDLGREILIALHQSVDSALRQKELERTSSYINYLKVQTEGVAVTEYRQALNDIIIEQEKRRMVASSDLAFAAEPLEEPAISPKPTSPRPALVIILSLMLGSFAGVIIAFLQGHFRILAR